MSNVGKAQIIMTFISPTELVGVLSSS